MSEESDLEKTEAASAQRLEKAREAGDVPRSRELATCSMLLAAGCGLWYCAGHAMVQMRLLLSACLVFEREQAYDFNLRMTHHAGLITDLVFAFAPLAGLLILVALATPMLIGGWLFSSKALVPDFNRLNPARGLLRMVSGHALAELAKALGKTVIVGTLAWMTVSGKIDAMLGLTVAPLDSAVSTLGDLLFSSFLSIVAGLVVIAFIDAPYQMWQHANKLKMTRQDLRQEARESDGNPEIKAKIRQQQRAMAQRRMMSAVPTADVIITNPTHYAVALKYADDATGAPLVVAKGADEVAAKIREMAAENGVPLLEAPALARALYAHTELGTEIPEKLYTAVAEVLAYVFQLKTYARNGLERPMLPDVLDVPPELDPLNSAAQAKAAPALAEAAPR
jgi:flagellar biosynthetic protein FlhB